ncbi:AmmeMemoRadiSam system protein B [Thermosulfurimonas marina]|uniref:AmmeMemoRadiSam system protein B n=1 Tax=Thermosulfurimonas marina TaxID=2047767 RepID=A0A6H1WQJ8_9BACT|nr:AmmeMemoRadiSam system protein B [Thermosulfurimonas marina]QJA05495.1 AmmeMemoRadiSam system protein B [Thermosulfurimonas marina]
MSPDFTPVLRPLDIFPFEWRGRPSLLLRDPLGYTENFLVLPQEVAPLLASMDGRHSLRDLQVVATRTLGRLVMLEEVASLVQKLEAHGFLDGETFKRRKAEVEAAWRKAPSRAPACAGRSYPAEPEALQKFLSGILEAASPSRRSPRVLLAPHLDLSSAARTYAEAYRSLRLPQGARVILLGTGHQLERPFSLLTKDFETPLGRVPVDRALVQALARRVPELFPDEFAHRNEHSLEFQVLFLRYLFGEVPVVPFLFGPVEPYLASGLDPFEAEPRYQALLEGLRALWDENTYLVLGIDFAHLGLRYGDPQPAGPAEGLQAVARDRALLEALFSGDYGRFLAEARASLPFKICGLSCLTFLARFLEGAPRQGEIYHQEAVPFGPGSLVSVAAAGIIF